MKIGRFDLSKEILVIAEIGNNHEGSYTLAEELVGLAAQAGAGAVKFQTFIPEKLVSRNEKDRLRQLKKFQLTYAQFEKLKKEADRAGILFLSTPFDIQSALFLDDLVPAFKIASGDNNFFPLIETIARTGKPIILSAGLTDMEGIGRTKDFITEIWRAEGIGSQDLAILHCVTNYPTKPHDANLLFIRELQTLGVTVGYSDHTIGIDASPLAVALGARIIEKHFTVDKDYSDFHDHQISADPRELKKLVKKINEVVSMLGEGKKRILECEADVAKRARRSITASRRLSKGVTIAAEDLTWVRPAGGLVPGQESLLIGKILKRPLDEGEKILLDDVTTDDRRDNIVLCAE